MMRIGSVFDILGPVMIGPSSSHTAGAVRLGRLARSIAGGVVDRAEVTLYGSFATTGVGHGTDRALVAGLLGLSEDDERIPRSAELAVERGLSVEMRFEAEPHARGPNTARIEATGEPGTVVVVGSSLGGGRVAVWSIDDFSCEIDGNAPTVLVEHDDRPGLIGRVSSQCGARGLNISKLASSRDRPGGTALMVLTLDQAPDDGFVAYLNGLDHVRRVRVVLPPGPVKFDSRLELSPELFDFVGGFDDLVDELLTLESRATGVDRGRIMDRLGEVLDGFSASLAAARSDRRDDAMVLVDDLAECLVESRQPLAELLGPTVRRVVSDAMALAALNAKMGRIVAAPTAGACGVVPAVLLNVADALGSARGDRVGSLLIAGMVGAMIAQWASVSGAEAGCQAECGTASAMAAAGATALRGQDAGVIFNAAALALKNHLGLTCDPVAGLVEVPCVKRNGFSAMSALLACAMVDSGFGSVIPFRDVVDAMAQTGRLMSPLLRESQGAGLAATATGREIRRRFERQVGSAFSR